MTTNETNTEDLETFMHRLLQAGIAPHDVSREGLNYAVAMMPLTLSAKDSLDEASKLLEQAVRNIGIGSNQLTQEERRALHRHRETK